MAVRLWSPPRLDAVASEKAFGLECNCNENHGCSSVPWPSDGAKVPYVQEVSSTFTLLLLTASP